MGKLLYEDLSGSIIGAAMHVLNELKPGLDEKIYERALAIELIARGHKVDQQRRFEVFYRQHLIGTLVPDMIVDDLVIVDPKVVTAFNDSHEAQMLGYLNITHLQLAQFQIRATQVAADRQRASSQVGLTSPSHPRHPRNPRFLP